MIIKKNARFIVAFALVMMFLCISDIHGIAQAEVKESKIFYNDSQRSIQFTFRDEAGDATIELIAPDGRIITMNDNSNDVGVMATDYGYVVVIKDAIDGQWKVRYDKGSNKEIDVSVDEYQEPLWITELNVVSIEDNILTYEFLVEYEEEDYYDYILSVTTDDKGEDGKVVESSYGMTNQKKTGTIDLSEIHSYDNYYLKLYVNYMINDMENFDMAYSEKFSYTNPFQPTEVTDFVLEVMKDQGIVIVNWEETLDYNIDEVYLRALVDGEEVVSAFYEIDELSSAMVSFEEDAKEITIGLSSMEWSGLGTPLHEKKIILDDTSKFYLVPDNDGIIGTSEWGFHYYNGQQQLVQITVNDYSFESVLQGEGYQNISLGDEINNITISYEDEQGIHYIYTKMVSVDTQPPFLLLLEEIDGSVTSNEAVIITGKTEIGATLTVNGANVVVDEHGTFLHNYSLVDGINEIIIKAEDEFGNGTVYPIRVTRSKDILAVMGRNIDQGDGILKFLQNHILWLGIVISMVFIAVTTLIEIILVKRAKIKGKIRQSSVSKVCFVNGILQTSFGATLLVWYIVRRVTQSSEKYVRLAAESVKDAYQYLETTKEIEWLTWIVLGICVCSWVIFLFCRLVRKVKEQKQGVPCPNCGSIRKAKDKFCGSCGSK